LRNDGELSPGKRVLLHGLPSRVECNGQYGQIVFAGEDGLWGVRLDDEQLASKPIAVKADNIKVVDASGGGRHSTGGRAVGGGSVEDAVEQLAIRTWINYIRQNPHYTLAALSEGVYVIGMKDQFNMHDLPAHPLREQVHYVADEMGFVLYQRAGAAAKSVDVFGPYFIEQYILMEVISKQEVAQNVLSYYVRHKHKLQDSLASYSEAQGKGFICWRFLMNEAVKAEKALSRSGSRDNGLDAGAAMEAEVSGGAVGGAGVVGRAVDMEDLD
jgi:hypothetical protein